jgi:hypothetical protein
MSSHNAAIAREIRSIRKSFSRLASSFGRIVPMLAQKTVVAAAVAEGGKRPRRRPHLTAQHRKALKLQGKYMGTMRGLPVGKRRQVKAVRAQRGIEAAIKLAERLAS